MKDRLDVIEELIETAQYAGEISELKTLHVLILEELRMLRGQNEMTERLEKALRTEFQK
jgi:hypothetical protein